MREEIIYIYMNTNISCLYESVILEQQANYFILEDKYNELRGVIITKVTDSKIEKFKTFISEKYKKLKEIIRKIINAIGKVLEKIFPFLKKKQNEKQQKDDNTIYVETYNIKNADKYIDTALKIEYDIEKIITNADRIKDEEVEK